MTDNTHLDDRGVVRQGHYGAGRQPWDDVVAQGWAPEFAAGNVLKYLRRTKHPEHSLESARWYHARLTEMMRGQLTTPDMSDSPEASRSERWRYGRFVARASATMVALEELLTTDERRLLRGE